jgi:hypothetical protein
MFLDPFLSIPMAGEIDGDYFLLGTPITRRFLRQRKPSFSTPGPRGCLSIVNKILWLAIERFE